MIGTEMQNQTQNFDFDTAQTNHSIKKRDGFFQVGFDMLTLVQAEGGGHKEVMAYVVLCGGVNGRKTPRVTTHGANSVKERTGMGHRAAEHAIKWLREKGFITPVKSDSQQSPQPKKNRPRWVINDDSPYVAVSRDFLDGYAVKSKPTLYRLADEITVTANCGKSQALIDAILLFARIMQEQDFGEWAGVHPRYWHLVFDQIEEDDELPPPVVDVPNTDCSLITIEQQESANFNIEFMEEVILNVATQDELTARFCGAMATLQRLRLVYRCLTIWDGDPNNKHVGLEATPLATLYVNDAWARDYELQAQDEVHRAGWRTGAMDTYSETEFEFDRVTGTATFVGIGRYRYIIKKSWIERVCVIGQLRVRHWPANEENINGRQRLNKLTTAYVNLLKQMKRPANPNYS